MGVPRRQAGRQAGTRAGVRGGACAAQHPPPAHARMAAALQFPGGVARSMEDLKERYYAIARKLLEAREANDAMLTNHVLIKYPFDVQVRRLPWTPGWLVGGGWPVPPQSGRLASGARCGCAGRRQRCGGTTPPAADAAAWVDWVDLVALQHERKRKAALEAMLNRDLELEERENEVRSGQGGRCTRHRAAPGVVMGQQVMRWRGWQQGELQPRHHGLQILEQARVIEDKRKTEQAKQQAAADAARKAAAASAPAAAAAPAQASVPSTSAGVKPAPPSALDVSQQQPSFRCAGSVAVGAAAASEQWDAWVAAAAGWRPPAVAWLPGARAACWLAPRLWWCHDVVVRWSPLPPCLPACLTAGTRWSTATSRRRGSPPC